jgi:hypothetical protein
LYLLHDPPKREPFACYLPYRCLLPKGLEGMLVVGIGVSGETDVMPVIRMQPDVQNMGYAAGVAAAMAAEREQGLREIDVRALQSRLVDLGSLPKSVLTDTDSFPLPASRIEEAVENPEKDLGDFAAILAQPEDSLPLLRTAYANAHNEEDRIAHAAILAMMGDATGTETLVAAVRRSPWDKGDNIETAGTRGAMYSRMDRLVIALGRTRDVNVAGAVAQRIRQLGSGRETSHYRAVALAAEALRHRSLAEPLADLLRKPGMTGHAITTLEEARREGGEREAGKGRTVRLINPAVRELVLARALYRCGDHQGLGEGILRNYEKDLRGHFARHAHAILADDER